MRKFGDAGIRIWRWFATRLLTRRKPLNYCGNFGRSDRIRTYDPLIPNHFSSSPEGFDNVRDRKKSSLSSMHYRIMVFV